MEPILTCPLGHECETIRDNKLYRCRWYINVKGKDPQSEEIIDRWDCAVVWQVVVTVENTQNIRGMTTATESFRNEFIKGQNAFLQLLYEAKEERKIQALK